MNLSLLRPNDYSPAGQPRGPAHQLARIQHGQHPEVTRGWSPASVIVAIGGSLLLQRGAVQAELVSDSAMVLEDGAIYSIQPLGSALCFSVTLAGASPTSAGTRAGTASRLHSEWIAADEPVLKPLLELYRRCRNEPEGRFDDQGAVAGFLYGLRQRQHAADERLARCPGRTLAHKRDVLGRLAKVAAMLDAPAGSPADLATLAALANYSPTHFLRLFAAVHGASPHDYQVSIRLRKAHRLVLHSPLAIRDIAERVGFESRSTFNRLFRRAFGCSAAELRELKMRPRPFHLAPNAHRPVGNGLGWKPN